MKDDLKECPKCGGKGEVIPCDASLEYPEGGLYGSYYVKCRGCGAHTLPVHTRLNAIMEWNAASSAEIFKKD